MVFRGNVVGRTQSSVVGDDFAFFYRDVWVDSIAGNHLDLFIALFAVNCERYVPLISLEPPSTGWQRPSFRGRISYDFECFVDVPKCLARSFHFILELLLRSAVDDDGLHPFANIFYSTLPVIRLGYQPSHTDLDLSDIKVFRYMNSEQSNVEKCLLLCAIAGYRPDLS